MPADSILHPRPGAYEFFAGGGMARVGLGEGWETLFANDIDPAKAQSYRANFGDGAFRLGDIAALSAADLPGRPALMWASFPCQDLSLAGQGAGLDGARSGAFWSFWRLVEALGAQGRAPPLVALENVTGLVSGRGGRDFQTLCAAFVRQGYRVGALVVDGALFTPQSRPRLFILGARTPIGPERTAAGPQAPFHPPGLVRAVERLEPASRAGWAWWRLPPPPPRRHDLADLLGGETDEAGWRPAAETERLLALMAPAHRARVEAARAGGGRRVATVCRRTRPSPDGGRVQRAEVRFDGLAGCLRTPSGGSSRQLLLVVEGGQVRSRLLTPRETARLMGLPDSYRLPASATAAYHLTGDGVVAPAVEHLARSLFEPLLGLPLPARRAA